MVIKRFEDIIAWQKAKDLAVKIYHLLGDSKHFAFKDQIFRASISISNNIAEGFDRHTDKEFIRFLYIANGSNSEVKSMLYIAKELKFVTEDEFKRLHFDCEEIGKLIFGFIKALNK